MIFPNATRLGLDLESTGLDPIEDRIVTIQVSDGTDAQLLPLDEHTRDTLNDIFQREVVIHNAYFDLSFLIWHYDIDIPEHVFDTMLAEKLLTAGLQTERAGLGPTVYRRLGVELDKSMQTSFVGQSEDEEVTDEQAEYALEDARILLDLARVQEHLIEQEGLSTVWEIERSAQPAFLQMWKHGITLDMDVMEPLLKEEQAKRDRISEQLQEKLWDAAMRLRVAKRDAMQAELDEFLARREAYAEEKRQEWESYQHRWEVMDASAEDLSEADQRFYDTWQAKNYHDTTPNKKDAYPEGMRRYVRDAVKEWNAQNKRPNKPFLLIEPINLRSPNLKDTLAEVGIHLDNLKAMTIEAELPQHDPEQRDIMQLLLHYKEHDKMLTSFGDRLVDKIGPDGKLRGHANQIGTATGRPSMSRPNMLQMPGDKRFRSAFVASPGCVLVVADYSQMELRVMAQMSGDPTMRDAFNRELDLHTLSAAGTFYRGQPIEAAMEQVTKEQRSVGKMVGFGILYGMRERSLAGRLLGQGINIDEDGAKHAIEGWLDTYPKAKQLIDFWSQQAIEQGWTATALGRKRYFDIPHQLPKWLRGRIQRQGANHPIQGGNADVTKLAMGLLYQQLKSINGRILLQVYDEIVVEVPQEYGYQAKQMVVCAMEAAAKVVLKDVPVQVDATVSESWNDEKELEAYQEMVTQELRTAA